MSAHDGSAHNGSAHNGSVRSGAERIVRRAPALSLGYVATSFVLVVTYPFFTNSGRLAAFTAVSVGALILVGIGRATITPSRRRPWSLLLAAMIVLNLGNLGRLVPGSVAATVSVSLDAAGYALVLAAAFTLILRRAKGDIGGIIDSILVSIALGGLLLYVLVLPSHFGALTGAADQANLLVIVFALTGVLGALIRLSLSDRDAWRALRLPMAVLALSLASNVMLALSASPVVRMIAAMMFMVAYVGLGLFGIDPSAQRLMEGGPTAPRKDTFSTGRLAFLGVAVAIMPVVVGGRLLLNDNADGLLLVVGSLLVAPLVMVRIGRLSAARARAEQALRYEAAHDPLTRLPNRREFVARLGDELRKGSEVLLLFLDLDGFKEINDRLGHAAGDQVLVELANRLRTCVRPTDFVSRFGGDEFLILLTDGSIDEVDAARDRIAGVLSRPVEVAGESMKISASIGAAWPVNSGDAEDLIRRADRAMYHAKKGDPADEGVRVVVA